MSEQTKTDTVKKWYVVRAISGQEKKVKQYIEMEIIVDELTEDVAIKVTEFCNDTESEKREIGELWHTQIQTLKDIIGA